MNTQELLKERGKTHGDFRHHAGITQSLKDTMRHSPSWEMLTYMQKEGIEMILHKLGRIGSGNPNHKDHWDDIAGYATLVAERLGNEGDKKENNRRPT